MKINLEKGYKLLTFDLSITNQTHIMTTQNKTYSQLNIHQKINFKAKHCIIKCDAIVMNLAISAGKYSVARKYTNS